MPLAMNKQNYNQGNSAPVPCFWKETVLARSTFKPKLKLEIIARDSPTHDGDAHFFIMLIQPFVIKYC